MKTSDKGRKFIEGFEGLILDAYDDANDHVVPIGGSYRGTLTIGYGHTNPAGPPTVYVGQTITRQEADAILASDLAAVERDVSRLVTVPLNQNQFDALVSFHFNTGALGKSTLLKVLNSGDYKQAAEDFLAWNHAGGQVLPGLTHRREAEKAMFLSSAVSTVHGPATAIIVAAGTTAVATQTQYHSPLIFLGIIATSILIGLAVHFYINRKAT